jgi:uncharacterized membrane protein SpoIIM required for sporulation
MDIGTAILGAAIMYICGPTILALLMMGGVVGLIIAYLLYRKLKK